MQLLTKAYTPFSLSLSTPSITRLSFSLLSPPMESPAPPLLLAGKSPQEADIAASLKSNQSLKLLDYGSNPVSIKLLSEIENPSDTTSFKVDFFFSNLATARFGRLLIWSPRLPSTHDVVSQNFGEIPIGTVCVADVQFKGRGRSTNTWESPPGCLMFSYTIQMDDGRVVPLVQYVASLAVTQAVKDLCTRNGFPTLDVRIKWPNDLYLNGMKVGGVLCTSTYKSKKFNICVGIGLNVDNRQPTTCLNAMLQDTTSTSCQLRKEEILASFFDKFEKFYDIFSNQGFQPLEELYYQTWLHSGQRIIVLDKCEDQVLENVVTIQGLTSSGYLKAIGDDGQMCELHPDGNSFDFLKGLVRHKLS